MTCALPHGLCPRLLRIRYSVRMLRDASARQHAVAVATELYCSDCRTARPAHTALASSSLEASNIVSITLCEKGAVMEMVTYQQWSQGARIKWGAIFAGLAVGIAAQIVLTLLGLAIGAWSFDLREAQPAQGISLGTGIWTGVSILISAFIGGYVTSRSVRSLSSDGWHVPRCSRLGCDVGHVCMACHNGSVLHDRRCIYCIWVGAADVDSRGWHRGFSGGIEGIEYGQCQSDSSGSSQTDRVAAPGDRETRVAAGVRSPRTVTRSRRRQKAVNPWRR